MSASRQLIEEFFIGQDVELNCLEYVSLGLDARREVLDHARRIFQEGQRGLFCVQIVGDRQQGKTMLMARLAHDLTQQHKRVYWSRDKASELLKHPEIIKSFSENQKGLFRKPRVYLFLDEPVVPGKADEAWRQARESAAHLVEVLQNVPVTITITSVSQIFPTRAQRVRTIGPQADGSSELSLTNADTEAIIQKWQEYEVLSAEKAEEFRKQSRNHRLFRKRLFAFLALLYNYAAKSEIRGFMQKFQQEYNDIPDRERTLLPIAACQILDVPMPARVMEALDPSFQRDHGVVTRSHFGSDRDDMVYVTGGPFLPLWLPNKLGRDSFEQLELAYGTIIGAALGITNFGFRGSERNLLPQLFHELARGVNEDLFGGRGQFVARLLFHKFKGKIEAFFNDVVKSRRQDLSELISWGWAFKALNAWGLAEAAYLAALDCLGEVPSRTDQFRLINGLKALPRRELRERAIPIVQALFRQLTQEGEVALEARRNLFTTYCELLESVGQTEKALRQWDEYLDHKMIEPDALLYMTVAGLRESLGEEHLEDARQLFERASIWAKANVPETQTEVNALQRYAVFLADHPRGGWANANTIFRQALKIGRTGKLLWEPVVCAQAEYQESLRRYQRARRLFEVSIRSYQRRDTVEPHAWEGLATFLIQRSRRVVASLSSDLRRAESLRREASADLAKAEELCREVIDDELVGWRPKLMAFNILGRLVGSHVTPYEFKGKARPDIDEAESLLRNAFDSPEGLRDDPSSKTVDHDVSAHLALRNMYSSAVQSLLARNPHVKVDTEETLARLIKLEEAHGRRAVEGLPREDTPGERIRLHVMRNRNWLAFFLWHDKATWFPALKADCFGEAEELYDRNLKDLEVWGLGAPSNSERPAGRGWGEAYLIYMNFARFRTLYYPEDYGTLLKLCHRFARCLPHGSFKSVEDKQYARNRLNSLAVHMRDHARDLVRAYVSKDLQRALELDECVLAMDEAWLGRFPDDEDIREKRDSLIDVIQKLQGRTRESENQPYREAR